MSLEINSMPDKIVLTYFNAFGRAEFGRLIMAQGGIEYEDRRITHDEWSTLKPSRYKVQNCSQLD